MTQIRARGTTHSVTIRCTCEDCAIDVIPDELHVRRFDRVVWAGECDGDEWVVEFDAPSPIVPPRIRKACGESGEGFVRPGAPKGEYKYTVYVRCGDKVCEEDPDLIIDD